MEEIHIVTKKQILNFLKKIILLLIILQNKIEGVTMMGDDGGLRLGSQRLKTFDRAFGKARWIG